MSKRLHKLREKWGNSRIVRLKGVGSTTPDIIFQAVVDADPTPNHKYVDWCLNAWARGLFQWEDIRGGGDSIVADQLIRFETNKHKIPDPAMRSLMKYRGPGELDAVMDKIGVPREISEFDMSSNQQKKMLMTKARLESIHHETESGLKLDIPLTEFASMILGRNTRWCTASNKSGENQFFSYAVHAPLFIFTLPTGERFQGHIPTSVYDASEESEEACSHDGYRKSAVISVLKNVSSYGASEAVQDITIMNENDTSITAEDRQKLGGYLDEMLDIMLRSMARSESIPLDPKAIDKITRLYHREIPTAVAETPEITAVEPPENAATPQSFGPPSVGLLNHLVLKKSVERITQECVDGVRARLKDASYIDDTTALDLSAFIGGAKRRCNEGYTIVQDYVDQKISEETENVSFLKLKEKSDSIVMNTIKRTLGNLKFREGFIRDIGSHNSNSSSSISIDQVFQMNMFMDIRFNNIEHIIDELDCSGPERFRMFAYLFNTIRLGMEKMEDHKNLELLDRLRERNSSVISLRHMISLDMIACRSDIVSHVNNFIANFDETYKNYEVQDKAAEIAYIVGFVTSPVFLTANMASLEKINVPKDILNRIDLSPCSFQKDDIVSLLKYKRYENDKEYIKFIMNYYDRSGISINAMDIFNMPGASDNERKAQINAALDIGEYRKEITPNHPLYFLSKMRRGNIEYSSYTTSFIFSDSYEHRKIFDRYIVDIQDGKEAIAKARLSCMLFVPNQRILDTISEKGLGAKEEVQDYLVTSLRNHSKDISLICNDKEVVPCLIRGISMKIKDIEREFNKNAPSISY